MPHLETNRSNSEITGIGIDCAAVSHAKHGMGCTLIMTDTENELLRLWRESLQIEDINIDQDFFDLGGNSFKAFMLLAKIQRRFSKSVGIGFGSGASTIRRQAELLDRNQAGPVSGGVRPLLLKGKNSGDENCLLFLIHGTITDELGCYLHLVENLPEGITVFGLPSHGHLTGKELETIEEMAEQHIEAIRSVQPSGPYYLGGFCFGGLIAYEIARQLTAKKEIVEFLAVFDYAMNAFETFQYPRNLKQVSDFFSNLKISARDLLAESKGWNRCLNEVKGWIVRSVTMKLHGRTKGDPIAGFWHPFPLNPVQSGRSLVQFRAMKSYKPGQYSGKIILFRRRRLPPFTPLDPSLGWSKICKGDLTIKIVDGSFRHGSILGIESAAEVANELVKLLAYSSSRNIPKA